MSMQMSELLGREQDRPELPEDLLQWVFHQDFFVQATGRVINARYLCQALRDLRTASHGDQAHQVRLAWQMLLDAAGAQLTGMFVRNGDWQRFAPKVSDHHNSPSRIVVWEWQGKRVVLLRQFVGEVPTDLKIIEE